MNYGFVIDTGSCIGCHACSTACKSENQVPIGVHRTWVKSVDVGLFPDVKRHFQVTRCNHCANPPCVRSCPTAAMFQRKDGIVEFDSDVCIGCKACIQACPYDAIYIDPETHTAAKCHMCAHRVDVGLEPACVVVCPEHAILFGDLDDPASEVARTLAKKAAVVRKPEQGTSPKLFYIEGAEVVLRPGAAPATDLLAFAGGPADPHAGHAASPITAQGEPPGGPVKLGGNMAGHLVSVHYDVRHPIAWHWPIAAYIVTKALAAGLFGLLAWFSLAGGFSVSAMAVGGTAGLGLLGVTVALLVYDLDRPERFFLLLLRPQWRSWVARAAWIITAFGLVSTAWWASELGCALLGTELPWALRLIFCLLELPLSLLVAAYTAFLLAQAEGRDLWQSQASPIWMGLQPVYLGALGLGALGLLIALPDGWDLAAQALTQIALVASALAILVGEIAVPRASELAARARSAITRGPWRNQFWLGGMGLGHGVPMALVTIGTPLSFGLALVSASVGLFLLGRAYVEAPQTLPNH